MSKWNLLTEKKVSNVSVDSNIFIDKTQFNQVLTRKCQFILKRKGFVEALIFC